MRSEAIQDTGSAQRLFIAVPIPETVKEEMEKAQNELRPALPCECVRWTKRAQFHLTLKFLGAVESSRAGDLAGAIRGVSAGFPALQLRAERIGVFPDLRYPRVIWAWVHDEREQLPKLQQAIETAAGKFTTEKPEPKFTGHVTLGRCQAIKRPQAEIIAKLAHGMTARFFGEWTAGEVELIRSEPLPGGSRYTVLASAPLAAQAPAERSSSP